VKERDNSEQTMEAKSIAGQGCLQDIWHHDSGEYDVYSTV